MMNAMLLLAAMLLPSYKAEDFHYYDDNLQSRGLPMVNKIYVDLSRPKDKEEFLKFADKLPLEHFRDIRTNDLDGLLLFFKNKGDTLIALNKCMGKYPAYPVVIFNGIECSVTNEIIVRVHPSVSKEALLTRLNKVADAKFAIVREVKPKTYLLKVEDLKNPANVMVLANLMAKDNFWNQSAMVAWIPIDGYVKANVSVETPSICNLGELRNFKITIDVFSTDVNVRTDLLPQLGQSLLPFPFAGEVWFDSNPPEITETKTARGKTITVNFNFRQLNYGTFVFQPIIVTYEIGGELYTVKTNNYTYGIRSVIAGTDVDDIQPRTSDGLNLTILRPVGFPKENTNKILYMYIKLGISFICFSMAAIFLGGALVSLKNSISAWLTEDEIEALWSDLKNCESDTEYAYYKLVSSRLNHLMTAVFGVSLYSVDLTHCTNTFKYLVDELDKMYQPNTTLNPESLRDFVKTFCKERKYK